MTSSSPLTPDVNSVFLPLGVQIPDSAKSAISDLWQKLTAPFPEVDIDWILKEEDVTRGADGVYRGRCFPYINARAVQQRLDDVFGFYWSTKMNATTFGGGSRAGVICELSVFLPGVGWLTKTDACDLSKVEPVRGGASGALKRVAVQFGIGRYLYSLDDTTVVLAAKGSRSLRIDNNTLLYWETPLMPAWALPPSDRPARENFLAERAQKAAEVATIAPSSSTTAADPKLKAQDPKAAPDAKVDSSQVKSPNASGSAGGTVSSSSASTPKENIKGTSPVPKSDLSPAVLIQLQKIFGEDVGLAVAYLKYKRLLPLTANGIEALSAANASALIGNSVNVTARMRALAPVARLVAGRHQQANSIFVMRSLVKANDPWFAASDAVLKQIAEEGADFASALDRIGANSLAHAA